MIRLIAALLMICMSFNVSLARSVENKQLTSFRLVGDFGSLGSKSLFLTPKIGLTESWLWKSKIGYQKNLSGINTEVRTGLHYMSEPKWGAEALFIGNFGTTRQLGFGLGGNYKIFSETDLEVGLEILRGSQKTKDQTLSLKVIQELSQKFEVGAGFTFYKTTQTSVGRRLRILSHGTLIRSTTLLLDATFRPGADAKAYDGSFGVSFEQDIKTTEATKYRRFALNSTKSLNSTWDVDLELGYSKSSQAEWDLALGVVYNLD